MRSQLPCFQEAVEGEFGQREMSCAVMAEFVEQFVERHSGADGSGVSIFKIHTDSDFVMGGFPLIAALQNASGGGTPDGGER